MRLSRIVIHGVSILALIAAAGCSSGKKKKYGGAGGSVTTEEDGVNTGDLEEEGNIDPVVTFEPDRGLKTGSQLRNTYLTVTGITAPAELTAIQTEYAAVETSLLLVNKMQTFDAGKQSSIVKLATRVCNSLFNDAAATTAFFGAGTVNGTTVNAAAVSKSLIEKFWGPEAPASGMNVADAEAMLTKLQTDLIASSPQIDGLDAAKGACAAVAASLPTLIL